MADECADKVVVVSGGSRGIGRGIAAAFAAQGAQTVLAASSPANLNAAADAIARDAALRPDVCAKEYHVVCYPRESLVGRIVPVSPQLVLCFVAERLLGLPRSY